MKKVCVFGISAFAVLATSASAQDGTAETAVDEVVEASVAEAPPAPPVNTVVEMPPPPPLPAPPAPPPPPPAPEPTCYLHVFPTIEGQAQNIGLFGPGLINQAINSDKNVSNAEYMRDALSPRFQVESFKSIDVVDAVGLPEGTEVIYEVPIADRDITTKVKTRLTESTEDCYAELIVTQNLYQKKMIYGRSLNNRFIFKDFRGGLEKTKMIKGRGGNGLKHFPPKTVEERPAADADLQKAFLANFEEYAKRFK